MVVLLLRVLGKVVGVMERVMLGLAPGIILGLVPATVATIALRIGDGNSDG